MHFHSKPQLLYRCLSVSMDDSILFLFFCRSPYSESRLSSQLDRTGLSCRQNRPFPSSHFLSRIQVITCNGSYAVSFNGISFSDLYSNYFHSLRHILVNHKYRSYFETLLVSKVFGIYWFHIEESLLTYLEIDEWVPTNEVVLGLLPTLPNCLPLTTQLMFSLQLAQKSILSITSYLNQKCIRFAWIQLLDLLVGIQLATTWGWLGNDLRTTWEWLRSGCHQFKCHQARFLDKPLSHSMMNNALMMSSGTIRHIGPLLVTLSHTLSLLEANGSRKPIASSNL